MSETIIKNPSWWNRRSGLERLLLISSILLLVCVLILFIIVIYFALQTQEQICTSASCVETASEILKRMNRDADPCNNFYEFTCGSFRKNAAISKAKTSVTSLTIIEDRIKDQMRKVLEEQILENDTDSFILAKKFYSSCINESKIELLGLGPIKQILYKLGGWPVLEGNNWDEENFDWKNLTYKMKKEGFVINHLINLFVGTDIKKPKKRVLQLYQSNLELPREFLVADLNDRAMLAYLDCMIEFAMLLGANKTYAEKDLLSALLFQRKLAEISYSQTELRNASGLYNPMFIEEMQVRYPSIPWLEYINNILAPTVQVENEEIVINQVPSFLLSLENLLKSTPKRTIANYLLWQVVKYSTIGLPQRFKTAQLKFLHVAAGVTELEPRWKQCVSTTYKHFDLIIGSMYIRKYFNRESKQKAVEIFNNIRSVFRENLQQVDWMDEKTRKSALEKLDTMNANIGYPDELLDDEKLNKIYENVKIKENFFLESVLLINQWDYDFSFSFLRKPVNKSDWIFHGNAATVGAFYTFTENSIQLPAGILQGSFFSNDRPNYMNYGAIGFTIGHEITHGFDSEGRQYNKDGMVIDWWAPETKDAFLKKAQCFIQQYNNYTVEEINLNVNGILTEGENIADNGGIKEAYHAYKNWMNQNQNNPEPQLPGLPYTPQQMFWISMAHTWCSRDRPDHLRISLYSDTHAPYSFRVIGSMSNQPEFSEDFNCPIGSKMNPKHKCHIW